MRKLIVRTRIVATPDLDRYRAAWTDFAALLQRRHVHAWAFQGVRDRDRFMEFVEFDAHRASSLAPEIAEASAPLEIIAGSVDSSTWEEWSIA